MPPRCHERQHHAPHHHAQQLWARALPLLLWMSDEARKKIKKTREGKIARGPFAAGRACAAALGAGIAALGAGAVALVVGAAALDAGAAFGVGTGVGAVAGAGVGEGTGFAGFALMPR